MAHMTAGGYASASARSQVLAQWGFRCRCPRCVELPEIERRNSDPKKHWTSRVCQACQLLFVSCCVLFELVLFVSC